MSSRKTPPQEREDAAALFATILYNHVRLRLPCDPHQCRLDARAINENRTASILDFRFREWPQHYQLSIHSDKQCSIVGYGALYPRRFNDPYSHQQLTKHLQRCVGEGDVSTDKIWAWYRRVDEPLRDFSHHETLVEVEKIAKREESKGDDAFRRASRDLSKLAEAMQWYSKAG